ncbi:hypothetical protein E2C01_010363 [Portunus trituberculatus]|uniref:Uncharacterized protein n=1 Tax=Portunus trituberculatus TaxID=210409 RepID=A0A5B7D8F9_PORTR|nr:hypothetical protein [Portunus trituberculatus]
MEERNTQEVARRFHVPSCRPSRLMPEVREWEAVRGNISRHYRPHRDGRCLAPLPAFSRPRGRDHGGIGRRKDKNHQMHQTCSLKPRIFKVLLWPPRHKPSPFCPEGIGEVIPRSLSDRLWRGTRYKSEPYVAPQHGRHYGWDGENPSGLAGYVR